MPKQITVKAAVKIPRVPNFLITSPEGATFPLRACEEDDLRIIGQRWTENLIERARQQRDQDKDNIEDDHDGR